MSGGGTGSGGGIGPGPNHEYDCSKVSIYTNLNSPNPAVLNQLSVGTILAIEMEPQTGAVAAYYNNQIAGTITHSSLIQLIKCLEEGYSYKATVTSLNGGSCTIHITNL